MRYTLFGSAFSRLAPIALAMALAFGFLIALVDTQPAQASEPAFSEVIADAAPAVAADFNPVAFNLLAYSATSTGDGYLISIDPIHLTSSPTARGVILRSVILSERGYRTGVGKIQLDLFPLMLGQLPEPRMVRPVLIYSAAWRRSTF